MTTLLASVFLLTACTQTRPVAFKDGVTYEQDKPNHWIAKKDPQQKKKRD